MIEIQGLIDKDESFNNLSGNYVFTPNGTTEEGFMWAGEWTVTYQTFRDMGLAFGVALLVIYMLVVWEFKNFLVPLIVMAPIPLTIIGIAPGHWLMGAEFTATSMIGFIALAGIIVRNSILLVDFTRQEIAKGTNVADSVIFACRARTRPIIITAVALVLGSSVILFDPIFQGMAVSLIFGIVVATLLTLVVIPLGCVSARTVFCPEGTTIDGHTVPMCAVPESVEDIAKTQVKSPSSENKITAEPKRNSTTEDKEEVKKASQPLMAKKDEVVTETAKKVVKSKANESTVTKGASTGTKQKPKDETNGESKEKPKVKSKVEQGVKKTVEKKSVAKKMPANKTPTKKTVAKKPAAVKNPVIKKPVSKESDAKKPITKKQPVNKSKRKRGIQLKDLDNE